MNKNGFAILYTVLIITIALTLSFGVANLVYKERQVSRVGKDSLGARVAADVGMECMLYKDKTPSQFDPNLNPVSFPIFCGQDNSGNPANYTATLQSSTASAYVYAVASAPGAINGPCFTAYLQRDLTTTPVSTKVDVYGYNICDTTNPKRVERGIEAAYGSPFIGGGGTSNPWTLIGTISNVSGSGGATGSTTSSINTTGANLIIVGLNFYGAGSTPRPPILTDSYGNTWTRLTSYGGPSTQDDAVLFYSINPTTGPGHTFTVFANNSYGTLFVEAWRDSGGTPVYDRENGVLTGIASSAQIPSTTPGGNNALIATVFNGGGGTVMNINSGFSISNQLAYVASVQFGGGMAHKTQSTATAENPIWTANGTYTDLVAAMAVFLP